MGKANSTEDFKRDAVVQITERVYPVAEVAAQLGISKFVRWRATGVWGSPLGAVSAAYDGDIVMVDRSWVCVHQHGAAIKKGR